MANQQRKVRFSDSVEVISEDEENNIDRSFISTDQYIDNDEGSVESDSTSNRSAWAPSEISFFSDHRMTLQKLDLLPRKPKRSLESILDDAITTLTVMSPVDGGRKVTMPPLMPSKHLRLDPSLFSIRPNDGSCILPPPPLSHSCIISAALKEITRWDLTTNRIQHKRNVNTSTNIFETHRDVHADFGNKQQASPTILRFYYNSVYTNDRKFHSHHQEES